MELLDALRELKQDDPYPMHMPGHKRVRLDFPNPYDIDITEIKGYDNLHSPEETIKKLSEEVAELYGADEVYLSVGGSTDMILTSFFAALRPGERILIARNCHKSVYHAAILRDARVDYLYPEILESGICGGIKPEQVRESLKEDTKACVITSPTYEGVISDIREISDICHSKGIPLIVDAAHGAHLGFGDFAKNPIKLGADAVIISLHKTLPSFTQTACLLRNKDSLIDSSRIRKYFDYFETSSPSYVLIAGIDNCVTWLKKYGKENFSLYYKKLMELRNAITELKGINLFEPRDYEYDVSKLVIGVNGKTGSELADILRRGKIEPEMSSTGYIIAMTSVMDTDEGFERLFRILKKEENERPAQEIKGLYDFRPVKREEISAAERKTVFFQEKDKLRDQVSGEIVTVYPPGIPLIVPGEVFTGEVLDELKNAEEHGLTIDGKYNEKYAILEKD